ncbi:hypothetical protein RCZ04_19660 [Capnocytophaga sp. HP1101]
MKTEQELAEFYARLKNELLETSLWPTRYLYKFVIPTDEAKLNQLKEVFKDANAEITTRPSSNDKYTGVSVSLMVKNPDEVIAYYKEAGKVEGILSL